MRSRSSPLQKRQRLPREEAREALLDAGRQLLIERGLDTGLGLVSLNDAIVKSEVPRASAYRIFASDELDPQDTFRLELLISYIDADPMEERRKAFDEIADLALSMLRSDDPEQLALDLREVLRVAFAGQFAPITDDPNWRVVGPSWAGAALNEWTPPALIEAHRRANVILVDEITRFYRAVADAAGIRLRAGFTWEEWVLMAHLTTLTDSFATRYHPELKAIMRPTGPGGELQPWTQSAVLVEGLVRTAAEPDPDAPVSADLSVWNR